MEKKRGGQRANAGRKKGEPTSTISIRVPTKYKAAINAEFKAVVKRFVKS